MLMTWVFLPGLRRSHGAVLAAAFSNPPPARRSHVAYPGDDGSVCQ
jgi:hypothetical protein